VLMDLSMPMMNGCEAAQRIREVHQDSSDGGRIPTIYGMSLTDDAATRRQCLESGMEGVLCKPIEVSMLRKPFCLGTNRLGPQTQSNASTRTKSGLSIISQQNLAPTLCMHRECRKEGRCVVCFSETIGE
jgi:CheY-like chemotaxis protein